MEPNILSALWTVVGVVAGVFLTLSFHFFRKKNNNVIENPNHTTPISTAATPSVFRPLSQNYEVFLNFRGTDTRKTFTDHLYRRLVDVRVCAFRDNEELHVGEEIHPNLLAAIQTSKISIPIISPDYASSKWCLLELVEILKCRETLGQIVLPIFYHVDPSDVRHQKGNFGKAFCLHKKNHNRKIVQEWKDALKKVASLRALELNSHVDGYEGKLVKEVVEKVLIDLKKTTMAVPEFLVGVKEQAKRIMMAIDKKQSNDVRVVLIHGMGGIGKTTLAKFLYNKLLNRFQFCSFLEGIHEASIPQQQKQLISNILKKDWPQEIYHADEGTCIINNTFKGAKVLLVLDGVDDGDQLNTLIGGSDWFGLGSIIIVTTRNRDVLKSWHVKLIFAVTKLDFDQSFKLFYKHALQREDPPCDEFEIIARGIVSTTGGLPLAIVVIGSFLLGKDLEIWKETLEKLKRIPDDKVQLKLKISYDALNYEQKKIFLDIACLPYMNEFENFMYMWNDCGYYPRSGIEVLKSLSLIKVGHRDKVVIHDQLKLLGMEIIRQQGRDLPGNRSMLWNPEEACEVLETNQGTQHIEVLNLASNKRYEKNCFTSKQFVRLTKLRLLQMNNANLVGNFKNRFLNLRWLQWYGCPSNFMATSFRPKNLVILNLSNSNITEQWGGWSEIKHAEKLKVLKLNNCCQLKATPDFFAFKELEILELWGCRRLRMIHPSICRLTKTLKTLNVNGCRELGELPIGMAKMEELRVLYLGETSIREIPMVEGFMSKLRRLSVSNCIKLSSLPNCIGSLTQLKYLSIYGCISLTTIPKSIGKLELLSHFNLRCTNIKELPESIRNLQNLTKCSISGTPIKGFPAAINMLKKTWFTKVPKEIADLSHLEDLSLDCAPISGLRYLPAGLINLYLSGCSMMSLPSLSYLTNLVTFALSYMDMIPELPSRLKTLILRGCQTLRTLPSFSNLKYLRSLTIKDFTELVEINALEEVQSLTYLRIVNCRKISKLNGLGNSLNVLSVHSCDGLEGLLDLSTFRNLTQFYLSKCNNIVDIQGLNTIKCLKALGIHDCSSLERIDNFSHMTTLNELWFGNCPKLRYIPCIDKFTSLKLLRLYGRSPMLKFPDLSTLRNLRRLGVHHFEELREIPKLQELKSLELLRISGCKSLENLPDFSEFTNLKILDARGCEKLKEFRGLENLNSFLSLFIFGCRSLKQLPELQIGSIEEKDV